MAFGKHILKRVFGERYWLEVSRCLLPEKRAALVKMHGVCLSYHSTSIT